MRLVRKLFIFSSVLMILWIMRGFLGDQPAITQILEVAPGRDLAFSPNSQQPLQTQVQDKTSTSAFDAHRSRIESFFPCAFESGDCPILEGAADSGAQSKVAGSKIIEELTALRSALQTGKHDRAKLGELIKGLLAYPDERVKLEALKLANETNHIDDSRLQVLFAQLENAVDPELIEEAIKGLQLYLRTSYEEEVLVFVEKILFTGSYLASRQMAESSYLLMYEGNRARFERWAAELPADTLKKQLFEASLHKAYP